MRFALLLAVVVIAQPASAEEKSWAKVAADWLDYYELAIGRYTRTEFSAAAERRGGRCKSQGSTMITCPKKDAFDFESASFDREGRAHYFSLTLATEEARQPCMEIAEYLKSTYGKPSYGIQGGGAGYNFPKKRRHIEFGPTKSEKGCVLSVQAGVRSK